MVAALAPLLVLAGVLVLLAVGVWPYGVGAALALSLLMLAAAFGFARFFLRHDTLVPPRSAG
jgi:hypothetical protein